jgi:hypothetical protein
MTWESNQDWHLGRAREPSRLPGATAAAEDRPWRLITALPTELVPSSAAAQSIRTVGGMVNDS